MHSLKLHTVPSLWKHLSFETTKPLSSWVDDVVDYISFFNKWRLIGIPNIFSFAPFNKPKRLIYALMQTYARQCQVIYIWLNNL